jgi:hypothetical protein
MLRGNFQLYNESGNLKLFSEPNGGQKGAVFFKNRQVMRPFPRVKDVKVSSATELPFTDEEVSEMVFSDHHEGEVDGAVRKVSENCGTKRWKNKSRATRRLRLGFKRRLKKQICLAPFLIRWTPTSSICLWSRTTRQTV